MSVLDMILWAVLAAAVVSGAIVIWRRKSWRRGDSGLSHSDWDSGGGDGGGD